MQTSSTHPPTFDEHSVEACYPTHIFGSDISNIEAKPHIVVVDYYSFFLHERPMPDMSSNTIILALKTIFNKSGVHSFIGHSFIKHHLHTIPREIHIQNELLV